MTPVHDSFTLTRTIAACRDHVWAVWSDPALKRQWFVDHDGPEWKTLYYENDFRVGGRERGAWIMTGNGPGAGEHANETTYLDIDDTTRIVYAYTMAMNGRVHSASLTTITLADHNGGTRLTYTEQMAQLGESDGMGGRIEGWEWLLTVMEKTLESTKK